MKNLKTWHWLAIAGGAYLLYRWWKKSQGDCGCGCGGDCGGDSDTEETE